VVSFGHAIRMITGNYAPQTVANQLLEVTFTVLDAGRARHRLPALARVVYRLYGRLDLIPLSTSSLMSMPRFALVLFPMFALFGLWGAKPTVHNIIVAFSLPLLGRSPCSSPIVLVA